MTPTPITSKLIQASLKEVNPFLEDLATGRVTDIKEIFDFSKSNHSIIARRFALHGEVAIPDLIASWESCINIDQKVCVIQALGIIASDDATLFLTTCLNEANKEVRNYAVSSLGQIGSPIALRSLIENLPQESDAEIRAKLLKFILKSSSMDLENEIIKFALSESDTNTRRRAVTALQKDLSEEATEMLLYALHDQVWSIANCAASGLKGRSNITETLLDKLPGKGPHINKLVVITDRYFIF